ncbi:hypothetical protein DFS34DRAFT_572762, partial [Phlyctochytrium arcticum]
GTGKSFLIKYLCGEFDARNIIYRVLAPTGVAALNVGGQTIHRFLGIKPDTRSITDYHKVQRRSRVPWQILQVLIIDEVSML